MDIVFLISHLPDPRYKKRFDLLKDKFNICVIFWNKRNDDVRFSDINNPSYEIRIKADQTSPLKRIPQLIDYGKKAIEKLIELAPKCVYVGNFDMLAIAKKYKKKYNPNIKIIYEIADMHRYIIDNSHRLDKVLLKKTLIATEKNLIKSVNLLVVTSWKFYDIYYSQWMDKSHVVLLPNMPNKEDFDEYRKQRHSEFTVGFIGSIRYKQQLKMLIQAAKTANVHVLFAGAASDNEIENLCKQNSSYCTFHGAYNYTKEIVKIYQECDAVYSVYDADMPNVRLALPNKLYEAIICQLPIIVAKNTYLAEIVMDFGIGIAVQHNNKDELANALIKLKNDIDYYQKICENCMRKTDDVNLKVYNEKLMTQIAKLSGEAKDDKKQ